MTPAEGLEKLSAAIEENPAFIPGYFAIADLVSAQGDAGLAERVLVEGFEANPGAVELALAAAEYRGRRGDVAGALELAEAAAAETDGAPEALRALTHYRVVSGDLEGGISAAQARVAKTPDDPDALNFLGVLYECAERNPEAIWLYGRAIELGGEWPGVWQPLTNLGEIFATSEDADTAAEGMRLLEDAARFAPEGELAPRFNLAVARLKRGQRDLARAAAEEVAAAEVGDERLKEEAARMIAAIDREKK